MKKARGDPREKPDWYLSQHYEAPRKLEKIDDGGPSKAKFVSVARQSLRTGKIDPAGGQSAKLMAIDKQSTLAPMKKLTLPRNADWTAAWVYYSCEDVIRRDEFEGFQGCSVRVGGCWGWEVVGGWEEECVVLFKFPYINNS